MNIHHIGVNVTDLEKSRQYYQKYFGFEVEQWFRFKGENILFLKNEWCRLELSEVSEGFSGSANMHIAWNVDGLDDWVNMLSSKGLQPIEGPYKPLQDWTIIFYQGPDNELIELVEIQ